MAVLPRFFKRKGKTQQVADPGGPEAGVPDEPEAGVPDEPEAEAPPAVLPGVVNVQSAGAVNVQQVRSLNIGEPEGELEESGSDQPGVPPRTSQGPLEDSEPGEANSLSEDPLSDDLMGLFQQGVAVDEGLTALASQVEEVGAQELVEDLRALLQEVEAREGGL